jgi:predicted RNA binding protein YcfA (HicA-like mRNA interferase family)
MLKPLNRRELARKLKKLNLSGPFSGGRHQYFIKGNRKIFIPNPHRKDIGVKILKRIIKDIEIDEEEFIKT